MKESIFGIIMGVATGLIINMLIFGGNLISAFVLGMLMTLFWCWFYRNVLKSGLENSDGVV